MSSEHCPYCNTLAGVTQTSPTHVRCHNCGREFPSNAEPPTAADPPRPIAQPPSDEGMRVGVPTPKQHPHNATVEFYYLSGLAVVGPLTGIELREAAFANKVVSDTLVTNDANGPWVAASLVNGLFDIHGIPLPHPPDALRQIEQARANEAVDPSPLEFIAAEVAPIPEPLEDDGRRPGPNRREQSSQLQRPPNATKFVIASIVGAAFVGIIFVFIGILLSQFAPVFGGFLEKSLAQPFSPARLSLIPVHVFVFGIVGIVFGGALGSLIGFAQVRQFDAAVEWAISKFNAVTGLRS